MKLHSLLACAAFAATPGLPAQWFLLPEPTFMGHEIAWGIPGSRTAVLVPVLGGGRDPVPLVPSALAGNSSLTRQGILGEAAMNAAALLDRIRPEYVRDERGVLLYVRIASENPLTASVVLAPDFASRFRDTIGPDVVVAIPNRFRVLVFPRSAPPPGLSDAVFAEYHASPYPISREIFEPGAGRLRAVAETR
jgi:hypothetical protein